MTALLNVIGKMHFRDESFDIERWPCCVRALSGVFLLHELLAFSAHAFGPKS